jgi:hypothetical protein
VNDAKTSHTNDDNANDGSHNEDEFIQHEGNEVDSVDLDGLLSRRNPSSSAASQYSRSLASPEGDAAASDSRSLEAEPNTASEGTRTIMATSLRTLPLQHRPPYSNPTPFPPLHSPPPP